MIIYVGTYFTITRGVGEDSLFGWLENNTGCCSEINSYSYGFLLE